MVKEIGELFIASRRIEQKSVSGRARTQSATKNRIIEDNRG